MTDERFGEDEEREVAKREKTFEHQQHTKAGFEYNRPDLLNDIRKQREIERKKYSSEIDTERRKELSEIANKAYLELKSSGRTKINGNQLKNEINEIANDGIEENEICYAIGIMKGSGYLRHVEQLNIKLDAEGQIYEVQDEPVFVRKSKRPYTFEDIDHERKATMEVIVKKAEKELMKNTKKTYTGEELKNIILTNQYLWGIEVEYIIRNMLDRGCIKQTEQKNVPLH